MKIVVSATGDKKESMLDRRFGRCVYFHIYDSEKDEYTVINNDGASEGGGAGIAAAGRIIDENVDIVITGKLGPNAYELLKKEGVKAYSCETVPVCKAIEFYQNNQLSEMKGAGRAHHKMR